MMGGNHARSRVESCPTCDESGWFYIVERRDNETAEQIGECIELDRPSRLLAGREQRSHHSAKSNALSISLAPNRRNAKRPMDCRRLRPVTSPVDR
jgi:hypothetical protein